MLPVSTMMTLPLMYVHRQTLVQSGFYLFLTNFNEAIHGELCSGTLRAWV